MPRSGVRGRLAGRGSSGTGYAIPHNHPRAWGKRSFRVVPGPDVVRGGSLVRFRPTLAASATIINGG